jgi:hypothetical protein
MLSGALVRSGLPLRPASKKRKRQLGSSQRIAKAMAIAAFLYLGNAIALPAKGFIEAMALIGAGLGLTYCASIPLV